MLFKKILDKLFVKYIHRFKRIELLYSDCFGSEYSKKKYIVKDNPEIKTQILEFFKTHPFDKFFYADHMQKTFTPSFHWKENVRWTFTISLRFPFLKRKIRGFGSSEIIEPYLTELASLLPQVYSSRRLLVKEAFLSLKPTYAANISEENKLLLENIDQFTCISFSSSNYLGRRSTCRVYNVEDNPTLKKYILEFFKAYPLEILLQSPLYEEDVFDVDHWHLSFSFEDSTLDRSINGYGVTPASSPYISTLSRLLPEKPTTSCNALDEELRKPDPSRVL